MQIDAQVFVNAIEKALAGMRVSENEAGLPSSTLQPLRELQLLLNPYMFARANSAGRFISFFLNSYINMVFMDLLGDIPDDYDGVLQDVRNNYFRKLVGLLESLLKILRENDNPLPVLQDLVVLYTDAVNELNYKDIQLGGPR